MININLLGVERKESLQSRGIAIDKALAAAIGSVLAATVVWLALSTLLSSFISSAEATKADNEAKIQKLDAELKEIQDLESKKASLMIEQKILRYVTGETYRWSYLLQEIRTLMPLDVQIKDLKFDAQGVVSLNGTATDHRSVALFLVNLQNSKMVGGVNLLSSVKETPDAETNFVITCKIEAN